jgi:hypothetical protein
MLDQTRNQIRQLVLARRYVVTLHAYDEMAADNISVWDLEAALLNGTVQEQQRDRETSERKYRVAGSALDERPIEVIAKIGPTGKLIVITAYTR